MQNPLLIHDVRHKIEHIEAACHQVLRGLSAEVPLQPARDLIVLAPKDLPSKKGFAAKEGLARLVHDLASIELQATELAFRTLVEFEDAPQDFREQLAGIACEEAKHLELCLEALEELGFSWGHWPVHIALWQATAKEDSLLDRILIVHRYLEGSGLDAGETLLKRLSGENSKKVREVVLKIHHDELAHVCFGSNWYKEICRRQKLEPDADFRERLFNLHSKLPRRLEPLQKDIRYRAGFTESEMESLSDFQREHSQLMRARVSQN